MTTKIMPISDLRRQTSQVIQLVQRDGDVVYITQHGRPAAVLVDYEQYEALLAQLEERSDISATQSATAESKPAYETSLGEKAAYITVKAPAAEARRLVNREIVPELGTGMGAKEPDLILRGQQLVWRVPIVLSLPQLGDLGEVGFIEVDAQSGELINNDTARERILQHAQRLYTGATLSAE